MGCLWVSLLESLNYDLNLLCVLQFVFPGFLLFSSSVSSRIPLSSHLSLSHPIIRIEIPETLSETLIILLRGLHQPVFSLLAHS